MTTRTTTRQTICHLAIGFALYFGTALPIWSQHGSCGCPTMEVVYCGCEGLSLRCGPGTSNHKLGTLQHGTRIKATGESRWLCGVLWQKVSVSGYMKIGSHYQYLAPICDGQWKVTWYCPGDNYVSMRSSTSTRSKRLAKIFTGTSVRGCHQECGYLYASVDGWVAVRTSSGKVYVR